MSASISAAFGKPAAKTHNIAKEILEYLSLFFSLAQYCDYIIHIFL